MYFRIKEGKKLTNAITNIICSCLTIALLASCGGDSGGEAKPESKARAAKPSGPPASTASNTVTLELNSTDQMTFDKKELRVKAGQKVTLKLNHIGKLPKAAMGHNFVLLKPGTEIAAFGVKAAGAKDSDYIPAGDEAIAYTSLIGGGESTSVTFDAPAKGTYDFICSFPGHYGLMQGKFIVE